MAHSISQKINKTLLIFVFMIFACAALVGVNASSVPPGKASPDSQAILFRRGAIDTRAQAHLDTSREDRLALQKNIATQGFAARKQLRIVQFVDAIRPDWFQQLKATGAEIIAYIPHNAYLIRGDEMEMARVAELDAQEAADDARPLRWMSRLQPLQKIAPELDASLQGNASNDARVTIELIAAPEAQDDLEYIQAIAKNVDALTTPQKFLHYQIISAIVPAGELVKIAALDEVVFVEPAASFTLHDERSLQIIAANLNEGRTEPTTAGYLNWLAEKGLNTQGDFIIDVADSGVDRGSLLPTLLHPDFLDAQNQSRIVYVKNYTANSEDIRGHGTLVASIICGNGADGMQDDAGYLYGLGVDPQSRIGSSRIFTDNGLQPANLNFTNVISAAYAAGARISNNSWGTSLNAYDIISQQYDALARDAQPAVSGNQEMLFVFSAGNDGAGGRVSSPGAAKNVLSVAASENYRPTGLDSCNNDGLGGIGPDGADSAQDILRFSSGGPTADGRAKPDLAAPGTHVHGAASQSQNFFGLGLCPGVPIFQPAGQQLYTWSSGTSLAAPHVTGAAGLLRKYFAQNNLLGNNHAPSPAMTKAFLINAASYMNGENAGGNLPQARQGWGLLNLAQTFDATTRKLIDQTERFTASGQVYELRGSLADRTKPLRLTLAWTDAPGALLGAVLVNDLDLEVKVGDATIYRGNNFSEAFSIADGEADHLNNVESVFIKPELIPEGVAGNFTITIRAANIAGNGVPGNDSELDQDFALVVYNIADPVPDVPPPPKKPVIANVTYVKKLLTITGQDFTAAAQVEINGKIIEMPFVFDAATNSLSIRLKAKKLKLISDTDNQIVVIENNQRSQPFTIRV
ncbi:MAG: S8 family serine peptidase [Acidobacteriota bacterium]